MKRRQILKVGAGAAIAGAMGVGALRGLADTVKGTTADDMQGSWRDLLPEGYEPVDPEDTVTLSPQEWKERLSEPLAFDVLRREATERPFTSPLNNEKREGVFLCAGCDNPLFTSEMKYDSGTGWPSFFTIVPGAFETKRDFKLVIPRTEYHCSRCGGHHGHVFRDGPAPTGQRWCNNGVALRFLPKAAA